MIHVFYPGLWPGPRAAQRWRCTRGIKKNGITPNVTSKPEGPKTHMDALPKNDPTTMPTVKAMANIELAAVKSLDLKI
jgi:hypothetical protein